MTLPQPTIVAAAISGYKATDAREWVAVDIVGPLSVSRRGYVVFVEPLEQDGHSADLASQVRDTLLHELRSHPDQPADEVLARAFGIANAIVRDAPQDTNGARPRIGATAIIFEDHTATIAHVPPGQLVLVQDHLVYGVPDLDSRLPYWPAPKAVVPDPEPFGFSQRVAPILVQTELMPGDTMVLCNDALGTRISQHDYISETPSLDISAFHARNPNRVLDTIRQLAIDHDEPFAMAAVIALPPNPHTSEIETLQDVARNAREQMRHARASILSFVPALPTIPVMKSKSAVDQSVMGDEYEPEGSEPPEPRVSFRERVIRITEGRPMGAQGTWQPRREGAALGAPGTHGVQRHRRFGLQRSGIRLKTAVPRAPFLSSPLFYGLVFVALFLMGALIWSQRDIFRPDESVWQPVLAQVDQRLNAIHSMTDDQQIRIELNDAQKLLTRADQLGASDEEIQKRQLAIIQERDEIDGVLRVTGIQSLGSLPTDLQRSGTAALFTSEGIYLANGELYRLNPATLQMQLVLSQNTEIKQLRVGDLFGVASDGTYLVVTDSKALFFTNNPNGANWQSMQLESVNNQGPWPTGPIAAYSGKMYLLEKEYRNIYAFTMNPEQQIATAGDWVSDGDRVNLDIAVDLAIDGNIYVLLSDGQVITYRSRLEIGRFALPGFDFNTQDAVAIVNGTRTGYLYVAITNPDGTGSIIAFAPGGENVITLQLPVGFSMGDSTGLQPFEQLQDIAVDEESGTIYLINGDAVWKFNYSLPIEGEDFAATPEVVEATP